MQTASTDAMCMQRAPPKLALLTLGEHGVLGLGGMPGTGFSAATSLPGETRCELGGEQACDTSHL